MTFVVGGLVVMLLIVLVLFWRISRKPAATPVAPTGKTAAVTTAAPQPVVISLEFVSEQDRSVSFTLDKPAHTIGRASDNDIVVFTPVLNADSVSQHHARLRRDQDGYVVRDLGSKNGLKVNGRHTLENLLQDGDRIHFGEAEAIFHQPAGGAA